MGLSPPRELDENGGNHAANNGAMFFRHKNMLAGIYEQCVHSLLISRYIFWRPRITMAAKLICFMKGNNSWQISFYCPSKDNLAVHPAFRDSGGSKVEGGAK